MLATTVALLLAVGADASAQPPFIVVREALRCASVHDDERPPSDTSSCLRVPVSAIDPQGQAVWLVTRVELPAALTVSRAPIGILVEAIASAEVYWDGRRIGSNGVVSAHRAEERPGALVSVTPLWATEAATGAHALAVRLSSHRGAVRVSTPMHLVAVGQIEPLRALVTAPRISVLLAAGALVLAACYFTAAMLRDRDSGSSGLVALMLVCALVQLGAEVWRSVATVSYPQQLWRLMLILGGAMGFGISMVAYVARRFRPLQWRAFAIVTAGWCAVTLVIPGFDVRTWLTLVGSCAIAFVAVAPGAWRNAPEARPIAGVLLVLLVVAVVEQGLFLDRDVFLGVAVLAVLLLIDQVRQMRRLRDAEREARARSERLELELLRRRLAPHWLMNTLNAITSWIEEEPRTAVRMVEGLADEFRQLARMQDSAVVLVTEEVAACRRLLELMSLRTGTPFALTVQQLSPELRVPPGVLHTLVENALTHGSYRDGAMFTLAQRGGDASPVLEFVAPAPSARSTRTGDSGFGLHYVRTRLRERFGDAASVVDGPAEDGGWRTVLTLGGVSA